MCACLCDVQFYITYWNSYQFKIYFTANQLDIAAVRSLKDRMQSPRLSHIVFTGTLFASLYKHKEKKIPFQALIVLKKKSNCSQTWPKTSLAHICAVWSSPTATLSAPFSPLHHRIQTSAMSFNKLLLISLHRAPFPTKPSETSGPHLHLHLDRNSCISSLVPILFLPAQNKERR